MTLQPVQDKQTVDRTGEPVGELIDGVVVRSARVHADERGDLCEIYNPAWGLLNAPIVYIYQVTVRPGKVRGWVVHEKQDDRLFVGFGTLKIVLYDSREDSSTYGELNQIFLGDHNRGVVVIPRGVYHAVQNIGERLAMFINMPTEPYRHEDPDKYRLSLANDVIPYSFEDRLGW